MFAGLRTKLFGNTVSVSTPEPQVAILDEPKVIPAPSLVLDLDAEPEAVPAPVVINIPVPRAAYDPCQTEQILFSPFYIQVTSGYIGPDRPG
jgi:hypothetical protein